MPRFGTMNVKPWAEGIVSDIRDYKTESITLPKAQILNLTLEIDEAKSRSHGKRPSAREACTGTAINEDI